MAKINDADTGNDTIFFVVESFNEYAMMCVCVCVGYSGNRGCRLLG